MSVRRFLANLKVPLESSALDLQLGLTSMGRLVYIDKTDIYYISVTELDQNSLIKFIGSLRTFCLVKLFLTILKVLQDRTFLVNR